MRLLLISLLAIFSAKIVFAAPRIDITKGNMEPLPIAINTLGGADSELSFLGEEITYLIASDLEGSGLFKIIDKVAFIEKLESSNSKPDFAAWRQINASAFAAGDIKQISTKEIEASFKLFDSYKEQEIIKMSFNGSKKGWRRIAHKIADEIYKSLTGEEGYFNTKIAFIAEYGEPHRKIKRLGVMDYDGENTIYLTNGSNLVLTPRFSHDASKILYLSYERRTPKVFLFDVATRSHNLVGHFPGMSFAPRFSPNDKEAVLSVAKNGNSDIYSIDLESNIQTKLTNGAYIDTSPYYAPSGERIVFSSDRSGRNQLYIMNKDGSDQKRITFGDGSYNEPAWSPRGDFIAFSKLIKGIFYIGVIRPDGTGERILTEGYMVEEPTWSPNGRIIMYTKSERPTRSNPARPTINSVDITGYHEKVINTKSEGSDPDWSPLLN